MRELLTASLSLPNLMFTVLLSLITIYWLFVILGTVGLDAFDFDLDIDADVDLDVDVDVDVDVDADVDADASAAEGAASGSLFLGVLRFFNLGKVPFMVLLSVWVLSLWSISVYCNHKGSWINPTNSGTVAAMLLGPIIIVASLTTKLFTAPLVPVFERINVTAQPIIVTGKMGTLMTSIEGAEKGQLKTHIDGSTVTLIVQSMNGVALRKGEEVVIVDQGDKDKTYLVQRLV